MSIGSGRGCVLNRSDGKMPSSFGPLHREGCFGAFILCKVGAEIVPARVATVTQRHRSSSLQLPDGIGESCDVRRYNAEASCDSSVC